MADTHPASFDATDPNKIITLITGIAQLAVLLGPVVAQLIAAFNQAQPPKQ